MSNSSTIQIDEQPIIEQPKESGNWFMSFIPMILIFFVFYFLLIRPQEQKRKEQENLISTSKKGDNIITSAGIYGKIISINEADGTMLLQIADNTNIKIAKSSVLKNITNEIKSK